MTSKKKYIVRNPLGLPKGTRLIAWERDEKKYQWWEGDEFVPPAGFNIARLVDQGKIEEV